MSEHHYSRQRFNQLGLSSALGLGLSTIAAEPKPKPLSSVGT